ncbi:hypothetical protein GF312_16245 [Candidatus Poribacteria bacterium]|nr:hypothetical protein [Candidatus Poribacteria bacterium]
MRDLIETVWEEGVIDGKMSKISIISGLGTGAALANIVRFWREDLGIAIRFTLFGLLLLIIGIIEMHREIKEN